uniref:Large ribosomal subunit protein uL3c n=1 Tax=Ishige okamurae TaxID=233772 RepID=A0A8E6D6E5_9PHAE|nr:ribosomal protein L3 [Ishige okamurae]QVJ99704.1 ribosomal protein L3 [Ishige okamurae]WAM64000.1 50S ribosomal protein L3 [Ishige okamurae]
MSIGIFGTKIGTTQVFSATGLAVPVTVIHAGPCLVTQLKSHQKDGYNAIQIGYSERNFNKFRRPQLGHLKKNKLPLLQHLGEYKILPTETYSVGQQITVENFEIGQLVNVTGKSLGKGFSGNQKRHHFKRGPMTHGSKNHRAPGSIGPGTTPGRVFPGKLMAGRLGGKKTTVSNVKVLGIDSKQNLLVLQGSVPGKPGNLLRIVVSR